MYLKSILEIQYLQIRLDGYDELIFDPSEEISGFMAKDI